MTALLRNMAREYRGRPSMLMRFIFALLGVGLLFAPMSAFAHESTPADSTIGRPHTDTIVGGDPLAAGHDSAYLRITKPPATAILSSRVYFVGPFKAEFLPNVDIVPETVSRQKSHQSNGDTFYFAHYLANHGNGPDSIALTGTTVLQSSGVYVTFFKDIGGIGAFDGSEPKIDSIIKLEEFETQPILVAVFVPGSYVGKEAVYFKATSRNAAFTDTGTDFFTVIGEAQVTPDTAQPGVLGVGDTLTFNLFLNVPCTEDTVIIDIDSRTMSGPLLDSAIISLDSGCHVKTDSTGLLISDSTVRVVFSETTGIMTVTFLNVPPSDTYVWRITILDNKAGVIDTTFVDTGSFIIDTVPPFFSDTRPVMLFAVDTTLLPTETAVTIRLLDTAISDTNSGIDSIVITIRDTAGVVIKVDTIDAYVLYQFPFDTPGGYTISIVAIDNARNTTALKDSLLIVIPTKRTIDLVAKDKAGTVQKDDIAKGLTAEACVTVADQTANTNAASKQSIMVTVMSDVDPVGILLELIENDNNSGVFEGCFGFTNGVSNEAAKKLKVQDGSVITATYDADGTGPIASLSDQITWQGILIQNLDGVRTWPNPYNTLTDPEVIFHNLPPDPNMTIEIYNLNAEKLRTLRLGDGITFSANQNIARWNARNANGQLLASGTYVYLVRSSFGTKVGKMTIVH